MNIFNKYKALIIDLIEKNKKELNLNDDLNSQQITFELPPDQIELRLFK